MKRHFNKEAPKVFIASIILTCLFWASLAFAKGEKFDKSMQPVFEEYLKIWEALAADKTIGVSEAAKKIVELSKKIVVEDIEDAHKEHLKSLPEKLKKHANKLSLQSDIETMRKELVELSKPMAMWATMLKRTEINVIYCSMKPGSWLQKDKSIRNP